MSCCTYVYSYVAYFCRFLYVNKSSFQKEQKTPMSDAGKNYRSLIDDDGECNSSPSVMQWTISSKAIENTVSTIRELIDIRDGYEECIGFSSQELDVFMLDLCTG